MSNELTYTRIGDFLLPDLILSEPPPQPVTEPLGKYAIMHQRFLQEHRPILYNTLLLTEKLYPLLCEIDKAAASRRAAIPNREAAHEIIFAELICT